MRIVLTTLLVSLLAGGCVADRERSHAYWEKQLEETPPASLYYEQVSLIRLIANPRDYNGRYVRVFGYLHMEFERDAVFVGKVDCEQWLEPNSISIGISRKDIGETLKSLSNQYVLLEGRFYLSSVGSSTLWNITRVEKRPDFEIGSIKLQEDRKEQPNQPPLQTPASVTPAADAPVAPPSGAAGR